MTSQTQFVHRQISNNDTLAKHYLIHRFQAKNNLFGYIFHICMVGTF